MTLDGAGGIEAIHLDVLASLGFVTSEAIIGPDISVFAMATPDKGSLLSHTDLTLSSRLTAFSREDGAHLAELYVSFDMVRDLAVDRRTSQVFFPDLSGGGIRVFDAGRDVMLTPSPIPTGALTPGYRPACGAPDHQIVYGPPDQASRYAYSGKVCSIGGTGLHAGFDPGEGSIFFLVVGNDGKGTDGSYGTDGAGAERPPFASDPVCPLVQDLGRRCD